MGVNKPVLISNPGVVNISKIAAKITMISQASPRPSLLMCAGVQINEACRSFLLSLTLQSLW